MFERGNFVSIYGGAGVGKTILSLQLVLDIRPSIYISTEGVMFEARLEKINVGKGVHFASVNSNEELYSSLLTAMKYEPKLLVIDTINRFYRYERNLQKFLKILVTLKAISDLNIKILLTWQMSFNNKVAGEKLMRQLSDDVLRMSKNYIIGNLRKCKFKITDRGVIGCL